MNTINLELIKPLADIASNLYLFPPINGPIDIQKAVEYTQKYWLRPQGKERWNILWDDLGKHESDIINLLKNIDVYETKQPLKSSYDLIVVLSASEAYFETRLRFLNNIMPNINTNEIVLLGGDRPIKDESEPIYSKILPPNSTEVEMLQAMFLNNMDSNYISLLKIFKGKHIDKKNSIRPTTFSTVSEWYRDTPDFDSILFISNQPFIKYQYNVIKSIIPENKFIDFAGYGIENRINFKIILDTISRILYEQHK